ncbi:MAG: hypothetical protein Q9223_006192 [Gallowayella weberi]
MTLFAVIKEKFSLGTVFSPWSLIFALVAFAAYLVVLGVYRIYFHPIARFPGPKLAALTTWYQGYYDLWLKGQYFVRVEEMHAQYGPVVRINPHELHFNAPDFIDEIYAGTAATRDKFKWTPRMFTARQSAVSTLPHELHRRRRAPMGNYFSKANIRRLEPTILGAVAKFLGRLESYRSSGEVIPLTNALRAMTCDIIMDYCFGKSTNYLSRQDYNTPLFEAIYTFCSFGYWYMHFGWLGPLMEALPNKVTMKISPGMASLYQMEDQWETQIREIQESKRYKDPENCAKNILHGLINSDLPDSEKTSDRLRQEARVQVLAGTDTTATTLANIIYHLLANPSILGRVRDELIAAIPDPDTLPTGLQVEHLPYLGAVIQEGIRLYPGVTFRQTRIAPNEDLYFKTPSKDWVIPKGTPVSMTARLTQRHPDYFPDPDAFKPERWLGNPRLDKYLLSFSKGTRQCLGINLAYQEMYLVLASLFRKYNVAGGSDKGPQLALYGTGDRDVEMVADIMVAAHADGSKGIRVLAS